MNNMIDDPACRASSVLLVMANNYWILVSSLFQSKISRMHFEFIIIFLGSNRGKMIPTAKMMDGFNFSADSFFALSDL